MKIHVLASGSAGNSTLVEAGSTRVLIDCGISGAEAARRLERVGCRPEMLQAIVVTHEHSDHLQGVGVLSRRFGLPVHLTAGTMRAGKGLLNGGVDCRPISGGKEFEVGDLALRPFSVPHDAEEPVGFTLRSGGVKAGLATDIGFLTNLAKEILRGCHLLVLEANHDPEMLDRGPYPRELKRRIRGRSGHLSNEEAGQLLEGILHDDLEGVVLAHLSEKSNRPDLALRPAAAVLSRHRLEEKVRLEVASQHEVLTVAVSGRAAEGAAGTSEGLPPEDPLHWRKRT